MKKRSLHITYYILASIILVIFLLPIIWMFFTAFKTDVEAITNMSLIPENPTLDNFKLIASSSSTPVFRWLFNSLFVSITATAIVLTVDLLGAYALSRIRFKGAGFFKAIIFGALTIPGIITLVPMYKMMSELGLINTYIPLILPYAANAFGILLIYQFLDSFPKELEESAYMDGASTFIIIRKVVLPSIKPILVTLGVITFMGVYNDYLWPILMTNSTEMRTLTTGVAIMQKGAYVASYGKMMALTFVSMIPVLIVFFVGQKYIVKGMTTSGIK